ncbi:MAG: LysM peptidoglycan-binding domain-containing protein [Dehalococcoidia bacterium]|nr:LysM peptidoglycan-binding domain-containing protein [Dehalococcoidia bacterium]
MHPASPRGVFAASLPPSASRVALPAAPALVAMLAWLLLARAATAETRVVQPGDTLSAIADEYGVTVEALTEENGITNPDLVVAGSTLRIPEPAGEAEGPAATYTVQAGDTLGQIALRFGASVAGLAEVNGLANPDLIVPGQILAVPGGPATARSLHPEVAPLLDQAADEFSLPRSFISALAWQESGWQQAMISHAGAVGIMQILPETAEWAIGSLVDGPLAWQEDALANCRLGAALLRHYLVLSSGDKSIAIAAYYQGWNAVVNVGFYEETKAYVANVLALEKYFE